MLLALGACASQPRSPADTPFEAHALYEGRRPPLDRVAVLLVISPDDDDGLCVVGRVTEPQAGSDYRPRVDRSLLELKPGRYSLEVYYWIARSRFELAAGGKRMLVMENLKSATVVPITITVEAGRTYYLAPELRRARELSPAQRDRSTP
ncbi:MAG: hypothetical protein ACYTEZ_06400 [Planctomycetota bacterium]